MTEETTDTTAPADTSADSIATAKEWLSKHGMKPADAAKWLHAQLPGVFESEADAQEALK